MATYRFRVTFEDHDEVSRDLEIRSTQTFEELHYAIHNAIGFDAAQPASFYMSDDNWKKGREITSKEIEDDSKKTDTMKDSRLCDFIADPHQKIYYVFDFSNPWTFRIELIKIFRDEETGASYPRCVRAVGEAPKQFGTTGIAAIPLPEEFESELDLDDDIEEVEETESDVLAVEESDLPEGEEKDDFVAEADEESGDDLETANDLDDDVTADDDTF